MRCTKCDNSAIYQTTSYAYCKGHFNEYLFAKVEKILKRFDISKDSKILIAYSGGKDSSAVNFVLRKLGFKYLTSVYINLDFDFLTQNYTQLKELGVKIIDIARDYGISASAIKKRTNKSYCKICSTLKRYFLNRYAYENGYDIIATGHNMSDVITSALLNIKNSFFLGFTNLTPYLPAKKEFKLVSRLKPLFYLTDSEIKRFCEINSIDFLSQNCPYAANSNIKNAVFKLEELDYNTLERMASTLIEFSKKTEDYAKMIGVKTNLCERCGYPSSSKICSFCKLTTSNSY